MEINKAYLLDTMKKLIETPSPSGYYEKINPVIEALANELGYQVTYDNRSTAYITLEGRDTSKTVCVGAHADTLGLMVRGINTDGTLRIRTLGGLNLISAEGENVTIHTRGGKTYTGLLICAHHSNHAYADAKTLERNEDTELVLLDEPVHTAEEVRALGIRHGDYISIDPRFTVTENGYIKSRFLDNKAAMACCFAALKLLKEKGIKPLYNTVFAFNHYEELCLGATFVPAEISEYVAVDIAILGPDADGSEEKVTIGAKDGNMPYDYALTNRLIAAAERNGCDYAVDLFYLYGSDAAHAFRAGNNLRPAAFGMGVYCSHGAERTHMKGIENTVRLLLAYLLEA